MSYLGILSQGKPSGAALKKDFMKTAPISITTPPCPAVNQILGYPSGFHSTKGRYLGKNVDLGQSDTHGLVSKESCDFVGVI